MNETGYKDQSNKTANYYNQFQQGYNDVYGDIIQAFRPTDAEDLMKAIVSGAGLYDGLTIVDAGCGIGGPAIWLAQHMSVKITGMTISDVQTEQGRANVSKANQSHAIDIITGDYHEMSKILPEASFDRVLFLESLGHAGEPDIVISEAFSVLKPGGVIYIKDFYYKEPSDPHQADRIKKVIANIDQSYSYNTLNLIDTIKTLRAVGFEIDFIRKFNFKDDISIRFEFEKKFDIDIFGGEPEFAPAEWLEIKCVKPI